MDGQKKWKEEWKIGGQRMDVNTDRQQDIWTNRRTDSQTDKQMARQTES